MPKKNVTNKKKNVCGCKVKELRLAIPGQPSQQQFAEMLQKEGVNIGKSAIQKIEAGQRFVVDFELKAIASVLSVRFEELLSISN